MGLKALVSAALALVGAGAVAGEAPGEKLWQQTYAARQSYFEDSVGPVPKDILKMLNMTGVWPGGGLFAIPAQKIDPKLTVFTTFGLTNPDMPAMTRVNDFELEHAKGQATRASGKLVSKQPVAKLPGAAGYGYELLVVAPKDEQWPLNLLQWVVNTEIGNDVGFLKRVEQYGGLTVERISVGAPMPINILIAKARAPLPTGVQLPAGKMEVLVATVITEDEMLWSKENGREALLQRLIQSGGGQVSRVNRSSALR